MVLLNGTEGSGKVGSRRLQDHLPAMIVPDLGVKSWAAIWAAFAALLALITAIAAFPPT
jgi:hypothetical protein